MIIQQDESTATYQINRFEEGKIWVNEKCYLDSLIIRPHSLLIWKPYSIEDLTQEDFASLLMDCPDIILFGTGCKLIIPKQELLLPLFQKGAGVEFMDSKAACYTYTVLAAEQRNVAACILIR